jgi:uncharacterized protein (TIGR02246 family)
MGPDQLEDFARRYTAAWCSQDPASVAALYAPDGSLTINGGTPSVGTAAITAAAHGFMVAFPDMQVLMDGLRIGDEAVEYHWILAGTNTGPGGTGKRVRISGYEEWTFGDDGLVAESQGHYDAAEYDRQLVEGF